MHIAVIIPFRGDGAVFQWVLQGFAEQQLDAGTTLEVRVCGDGVEVPTLPPGSEGVRFSGMKTQWVGTSEAKNLLLRGRPADVVIFANSDTRPAADMVKVHAARLMSLPPKSLVLGAAPYERAKQPTVFDVLVEETPMIFFYSQLVGGRMYDFRQTWTLNLSARYSEVAEIGFFNERFRPYGFEDLDLGFRLMGTAASVFYEPAARVTHWHPMTFDQYLNREELLGVMSVVLAEANPALFEKLHGTRDVERLGGQFRSWLEMDRASHGWVYKRTQEWNVLAEAALGKGADRQRLMLTLYQMHIPLKRMAFRVGFLRGLELRDDARWRERAAAGEWRKMMGL